MGWMRFVVVVSLLAGLTACSTRPPAQPENLCQIFREKPEWHKAALKVAFVGLALERVVGLAARADAAFAQSLVDLACEREAATRPVPPAMWPIAARFPPPGLAAKLLGYLEHPSPDHRAAAAAGLATLVATDPRVRPFLADRAAREPVPAIRQTLSRALEA